jgi:hypothetical protein
LLYLVFRRRLGPQETDQKLWFWMAVLSLACVPLVLISSTATDRVALYFIPIQMYVLSRLQRLSTTTMGRTSIVVAVVAYCAFVLFVWTHFAVNAPFWVPYKFMPL